jgi:glycosyltransferase involved in cell wall biosynthesis
MARSPERGRDLIAVATLAVAVGLFWQLRKAMLAGAPLVVSDLPAFPGALRHGETGLRVPPDDVAALAQAIRDLALAPERARALGRAAREAAGHFRTWDEIATRVLAEYAVVVQ